MLRQNVIPFWKELFVAYKNKETLSIFLDLQPFISRSFRYTEVFLKQIAIHDLVHVRIYTIAIKLSIFLYNPNFRSNEK